MVSDIPVKPRNNMLHIDVTTFNTSMMLTCSYQMIYRGSESDMVGKTAISPPAKHKSSAIRTSRD